MNAEKIGKFIQEFRNKKNLTVEEMAAHYEVSVDDVNNWEAGKLLPDLELLKRISNDMASEEEFATQKEVVEEVIVKEEAKHKYINRHLYYISILSAFLVLSVLVMIKQLGNRETYMFKTMSTSCTTFTITGDIAYDKPTSSIYLTGINYCGGNDKTIYDGIEGAIFIDNNSVDVAPARKNITLEEYLHDVHFTVDKYLKICSELTDDAMHIEIVARKDNDITNFRVGLNILNSCHK